MSTVVDIALLVLIASLCTSLAAGALYLAAAAYISLSRHRRRRRRALRPLSDREVADALAPFGADISIWPARAPRNGTAADPVD